MTTGPAIILDHLRRTLAAPALAESDGALLRRFAGGGPAAGPAFEALLRRHGPLVWRACRAALHDTHAAEDAFQATFLVLVHKARSLRRPDALGPWLFGVARRLAARARADAARRRVVESRAGKPEAVGTAGPEPDVAAVVHEEVGRLPEGLRAAVVLCDLEGLTYEQAAGRLGWTHATLRGRLARAREQLRRRLARLGLGPAALALAPLPVPRALSDLVARAALAVAAGESAGAVPAPVLILMNGALQPMFVTKLKSAALSFLAGSVLVAGALGLGAQAPAPKPTPAREGRVSGARLDPAEHIAELARRAKRQQGTGDADGALQTLGQAEEALRQWQHDLRQDRDAEGRRGQAERLLRERLAEALAEREQLERQVRDLTAARQQAESQALEQLRRAKQAQDLALSRQQSDLETVKQDLYLNNARNRAETPARQKGKAGAENPNDAAPARPVPASDLDSRLREVERKLDRLLQSLERKPDPLIGRDPTAK